MHSVTVTGRFVDKSTGQPVDGEVWFVPSRLWNFEDGVPVAPLAARVRTKNGAFKVQLSATTPGWHYTVSGPMGQCTIKIPLADEAKLKDLIPTRYQV